MTGSFIIEVTFIIYDWCFLIWTGCFAKMDWLSEYSAIESVNTKLSL